MALKETFPNLFKHKKESTNPTKNWEYHQFRDYLLSISKGPEFILPYDQYPERIRLSKPWHEFLNQMREESKDGNERFAWICYKNDSKNLYLPKVTGIGKNDRISYETAHAEWKKVNKVAMGVVGDIHSHPVTWNSFRDFSSSDLFTLLVPSTSTKMIGLAEIDENLFAFRSRETEMAPTDLGLTQDQFKLYWKEKAISSRATYNAIIQRHKLVIYSGKPNGELKKRTSQKI